MWHTVTFDTGSSVFGIFSKSPPHYDAGSMFDHTGGLLASKVTIIAIAFVVVVVIIAVGFVIRYAPRTRTHALMRAHTHARTHAWSHRLATSSTRDVKVGSSEEKRTLL